eukprot:TRINITY_DN33942_c0_g1_i3.p4 TRINITY_DN33942_c0_g1~~TRINITY_DN33942_c0_g1_i3.p4  ORF type:complete len:110 (-),score=2.32 TRINITY_DN33942_c0_g1_i3:175-504(-)
MHFSIIPKSTKYFIKNVKVKKLLQIINETQPNNSQKSQTKYNNVTKNTNSINFCIHQIHKTNFQKKMWYFHLYLVKNLKHKKCEHFQHQKFRVKNVKQQQFEYKQQQFE